MKKKEKTIAFVIIGIVVLIVAVCIIKKNAKEICPMNTIKLAGLEPANVFGYFEEICSMPHGSGNTKIISDYLVKFAQEQGLEYIQDDLNDVIIFVPGTCGMEDMLL